MMLYLIGGLLAACIALGGIASCEYRQKNAAYAEAEAVKARFDGFVIEVERKGKEQEEKAKAKEDSDRAIHAQTVALLKNDLATRDAAIKRLRDSPITRPDRSPVPVFTKCAEGANGTSQELIAVVEYRELQARAFDDARTLTRLQEWVRATGHPVE